MQRSALLRALQSKGECAKGVLVCRWMPSTIPVGYPLIGIVFARLLVEGMDWGVRPFIVQLNDGKEMCKGVEARQVLGDVGCTFLCDNRSFFEF